MTRFNTTRGAARTLAGAAALSLGILLAQSAMAQASASGPWVGQWEYAGVEKLSIAIEPDGKASLMMGGERSSATWRIDAATQALVIAEAGGEAPTIVCQAGGKTYAYFTDADLLARHLSEAKASCGKTLSDEMDAVELVKR